MQQYLEFLGNNLVLVGIWIALAAALIFHRNKSGAQAVGPQQAVMMINRNDGVVLDIRDKKEFDAGHIVDSIHIPHNKLAAQVAELDKLKARPIIVVCKMGQHSGDACKILRSAGFEQVVRLRGGMAEWRAQNLPLIQKGDKSKAEKAKALDKKPGDKKPGDKKPGDKKSAKDKPPRPRKKSKAVEQVAPEAVPVADANSTDETEAVQPEPVQPEPVQPEPVQPEPARLEQDEAEAPAEQEEVKQGDQKHRAASNTRRPEAQGDE